MIYLIKFFHFMERFYSKLEFIFLAMFIGLPFGFFIGYKYGEFLAYSAQYRIAEQILYCMSHFMLSASECLMVYGGM